MTDILMPALSPTMEDGALAKWLVKPGDKVEVDFSPLRDTSLKGGALKKLTNTETGQVLTANIRAQEMPGLE